MLELVDGEMKWFMCYVGRHELLGDTVWVASAPSPSERTVDCRVFSGDGFFAFYSATAAARSDDLRKVAFCPDGMHVMPPLLRFVLPVVGTSRKRWRVAANGKLDTPFVLRDALSLEESLIPPAVIWNHAAFVARLRSGWHPRDDSTEAI